MGFGRGQNPGQVGRAWSRGEAVGLRPSALTPRMPGTWASSRRAAWGAGHLKVAALLPQALLLALVPSGEEQSALPAGR